MKVDFHPEAEEEFLRAIEYYERCEPGLGEDFSLEIYSAIQNIVSYPGTWSVLEDDVRRCLVHRFPFGILYHATPEEVFVLAVMHLHRHPDYWKGRR